MTKKAARRGRPSANLERVKFFVRAAPGDVAVFRSVGPALSEVEGRRVTDAEVFRLAVRALVASLPDATRQRLERGARLKRGSAARRSQRR